MSRPGPRTMSLQRLQELSHQPVPLRAAAKLPDATYALHPDPARYLAPTSVQAIAVGDLAAVRAFGRWRHGIVTAVGRSRVRVSFVTPASPAAVRDPWQQLLDVRLHVAPGRITADTPAAL